jgi:threonine dehydratase
MDEMPERSDVEAAAARLKGKVMRTPVLSSRLLNERMGVQVFLKCENLQFAGAFKFRGVMNVISQLSPEERSRGVITHSSGNHAQALALAAKRAGIRATIVMPEGSNPLKREATKEHGAHIISCENTQEAREQTCQAEIDRSGMVLVHP